MPMLTLQDWSHQEQALLNLLRKIEASCCTKSISTKYNNGSDIIPEAEAIGILVKKYAALEAQLPQAPAATVDAKTLAQYHACNIEVQQTFWRCSVIAIFKQFFNTTDEDVKNLNRLLKEIALNTQRYLVKLPQISTADKITGNAVILNALLTGAINIAADTAFGPIGPCIASFSLAIVEHTLTYYLAAPKDPTKIMLRHLDPNRFIKLFEDCHGDTTQVFHALENLNRQLSTETRHWYNAAQWGLAAALGESVVRATSGTTSFLGSAAKFAGRFFVPRCCAQTVTPPAFEDLVAETLSASPAR